MPPRRIAPRPADAAPVVPASATVAEPRRRSRVSSRPGSRRCSSAGSASGRSLIDAAEPGHARRTYPGGGDRRTRRGRQDEPGRDGRARSRGEGDRRSLYASWSGSELAAHAPLVAAGLVRPLDHDQTNPPVGQDAVAARDHRPHSRTDAGDLLCRADPRRRRIGSPRGTTPSLRACSRARDIAVLAVLLQRPDPERQLLDQLLPADTQRIRLRPFSERELDELSRRPR